MRNRSVRVSTPLHLQIPTAQGDEAMVFTLVRNDAGDYPHLRIARPKTGEHVNSVFVREVVNSLSAHRART